MKAACADGNQGRRAENVGQRREDLAVDLAEVPTSPEAEGGTLSVVFCWSGNEELELPANAVVYDGFGKRLCEAETDVPGHLAYTGLANDPEEGLGVTGARIYNPSVGRWTVQDPVGFAGGDANLYRFAACDVRGQLLDKEGNLRDA